MRVSTPRCVWTVPLCFKRVGIVETEFSCHWRSSRACVRLLAKRYDPMKTDAHANAVGASNEAVFTDRAEVEAITEAAVVVVVVVV